MRRRPRTASSRSRSPPRGVGKGGDRGRHGLAPPSVRSAGRGRRAAPGAASGARVSGARVSVPLTAPGSNRGAEPRRSAAFAASGHGEPGRGWAPLQRRTRSHPRRGPGTVLARQPRRGAAPGAHRPSFLTWVGVLGRGKRK